MTDYALTGWLEQLRKRGVLRVAAGYAVIGWLLLQIADVTFEPLGAAKWAMSALILAVLLGFPVAVILAWFYELGDHGLTRDLADPTSTRPQVHGPRRYADLAIIGVLLLAVAVLAVRQSDIGKPPPPARPSLAVLPFANLSGDPGQQYFSDGLAEEVLDKLGQVPGLMVVARSSSFGYRDKNVDVRKVAEQLGVNSVLEGAVRRDGKRLRLSAKLLDGKSGYQLWSGSFDREVNDVFAVQAELAQAVIHAIVPVARGDQPINAKSAPPPTTSLTAYDLYLVGRAQVNARWESNVQKAVDYFTQALEQDPKFAKAQAALAAALVLQIHYSVDGTARAERIAVAEPAVYKALALDPKLADAQVAYANFLNATDRDGVEDAYKRAIATNPNSAEAWHGYSNYLSKSSDRDDEAAKAVVRAHTLDPLAVSTWMNYISRIHRPGGEAFRAELDKAKAAFADQPDALLFFARGAYVIGYPMEAWSFLIATRNDASLTVSRGITEVGPLAIWMYVDPAYVLEHGEPLMDDAETRSPYLAAILIAAAGRLGREEKLWELFARVEGFSDADASQLAMTQAFWLLVFGDGQGAAKSLATVEDGDWPPFLESNGLPAKLRIYRATGRGVEADKLAKERLAAYRAARPKNPDETNYDWIRDAALAANEGLKDEAVELLRQALRWQDVPLEFTPELPWFKSLEGHAPYDKLLAEHAKRVAKAREGMLALDATSASSPISPRR